MDRGAMSIIAILLIPVLLVVMVVVVLSGGGNQAQGGVCGPSGGDAVTVSDGQGSIGPWDAEQVANAVQIMNAGADLGLSQRDQTIGVMTAIGESSLQVLDKGDAVGPDSRGLFQQRDNGAWGSYEDRMDPYTSATNFFTALKDVSNRDSLPLTEAAHRVQGNQDPNHYAAFEQQARDLIAQLQGGAASTTSPTATPAGEASSTTGSFTLGGGGGSCTPVSAEGVPDQSQHGEPSTDLACPDGSTDLGVHDGAYNGARMPIRLCSITGTVCSGSDCAAGELGGLARGEVVINARYAPYLQAWLADVRAAGFDPTFSSSFRSWETQARISGGGSNANAATSGQSHHQTGAAVDVAGLPGSYNKNQCTGTSPDGGCMTSGDLWAAMHTAGLAHGMTVHDEEFWHFEFILSGDYRGRTNPFTQQ